MAHYSVFVALEDGRLVARATRDFRLPVSAAVLVVAVGDEISWLCESGELRLVFEESPFQSGVREINVPRGRSAPLEARVVRAGKHPEVFRYAVRLDSRADRPADGVAHIIVEVPLSARAESEDAGQTKEGARPARSEAFRFEPRDWEFLDRALGEDSMSTKHKLKIKKTGSKVDYDYEKDSQSLPAAHAIPYMVVKPGDEVEFEAPNNGVVIIAFSPNGSPFDGAPVFVLEKTKTKQKTVKEPDEKGFFGYKYTTVLLEDLGPNIFVDDPQIIIDNNG